LNAREAKSVEEFLHFSVFIKESDSRELSLFNIQSSAEDEDENLRVAARMLMFRI
jgi:hypothetical protein